MLSHMESPRNIAARAGRWSAQNRKKAILGWLAFVIIALVVGQGMGMNEVSKNAGPGESGQAGSAIERAFPKDEGASEQVLVQKKPGATDAQFRAAIDDTATKLQGTEHVKDVTSPLHRGNSGQLSPDGKSALVTFEVRGEQDAIETNVEPAQAAVASLQKANPELRVEQ